VQLFSAVQKLAYEASLTVSHKGKDLVIKKLKDKFLVQLG
jgi:hypothetical protein